MPCDLGDVGLEVSTSLLPLASSQQLLPRLLQMKPIKIHLWVVCRELGVLFLLCLGFSHFWVHFFISSRSPATYSFRNVRTNLEKRSITLDFLIKIKRGARRSRKRGQNMCRPDFLFYLFTFLLCTSLHDYALVRRALISTSRVGFNVPG